MYYKTEMSTSRVPATLKRAIKGWANDPGYDSDTLDAIPVKKPISRMAVVPYKTSARIALCIPQIIVEAFKSFSQLASLGSTRLSYEASRLMINA